MDEQDFDCNPCLSIPTSKAGWIAIIIGIIITFILRQTFYLPGPRCDIQLLYVPALDLSATPPENTSNSTNATANPCLFFDLSLHNILSYHGISYGDVNLTFSYGHKAVANYVIPSFYQGRGQTAQRRDVVETRGLPWGDAVKAVSSGSKAFFRVELAARPRFRFLFWYSKEKDVRIAAVLEVDGTGMKDGKDDIRLDSVAAHRGIGVFLLFSSLLLTTFLLY